MTDDVDTPKPKKVEVAEHSTPGATVNEKGDSKMLPFLDETITLYNEEKVTVYEIGQDGLDDEVDADALDVRVLVRAM